MSHIILLVTQSENRRLLAQYLKQHYDVSIAESPEQSLEFLNNSFDLCIIDGIILKQLGDLIQTRKLSVEPVLLPVLLIAHRPDFIHMSRQSWDIIDELVAKPIEKAELRLRVDMLIRSRYFSLQLQDALLRERELNQLKSHFISLASHEFRNPLNSILGLAQLLESSHTIPEAKQSECIQRIKRAGHRMNLLLNDVLAAIKSESSHLSFNPVPISLEPFCQALVEEICLSTDPTRTIHCVYHCVYEGDQVKVSLDETLLQQILSNILSNALKYSASESSVHLTVICQPESIIFEVQDNGIGISVQDQQKLFNAYFRATNVGATPGTGLGLTIAKQAVEQHGGTISLNSEINKGTTVTVTLPISS